MVFVQVLTCTSGVDVAAGGTVGGTRVAVGGIGVGVGRIGVAVGGIGVGGIGVIVGGIGVGSGVAVGFTHQPFLIPSEWIASRASVVIPHRFATSLSSWASVSSRKICFLMGSMKLVSASAGEVGVARSAGVLVGAGVNVGTDVGVASGAGEEQAPNSITTANSNRGFLIR